jgi:hypothetical protein
MHFKLKPLSIDLHATTRSNETSELQSTYLGHVPLMKWILNHLKSRLQNTFSHTCYKTLAFLQSVNTSMICNKRVPLQINLICKKVIPRMRITIDCEIQAIANDDQSNIFTSLN